MNICGALTSMAVVLAIATPSFTKTNISLERNFRPDPVILGGIGGGNVSLASLAKVADNCRGFAKSEPNHTITLNQKFPVFDFLVYSRNLNDNPTMLVKGPNGIVICAEDESGRGNSQINQLLPKGTYQVWVGSKTSNKFFEYSLSLSETRQK